jgi:hypothetical protein
MTTRVLPAVLAVLALTAGAIPATLADTYTFAIPDPNGSNYLDLGMSFESISDVRIACSGNAVFGRYLDQSGQERDYYPKVVIDIWDDASLLYQRSQMIDTPGYFSDFELDTLGSGFDFLMDGHTNLRMRYGSVALGQVYSALSYPSIEYSSAQLIIDGTISSVPEPACILTLALGLSGLLIRKRLGTHHG